MVKERNDRLRWLYVRRLVWVVHRLMDPLLDIDVRHWRIFHVPEVPKEDAKRGWKVDLRLAGSLY